MTRVRIVVLCLALIGTVSCESQEEIIARARRQAESEFLTQEEREENLRRVLCKGKDAGEWFRLSLDNCAKVIQCTEAGLQALQCPNGLFFDVDEQTCDWQEKVKNCNRKEKERVARPLINTVEPLCQENQLACGDGQCIERHLFCDGTPNCSDGSDENVCDLQNDPNRAPKCNKEQCLLPDCFCFNDPWETPDNMAPENIPQMITLTFDDAVNNVNSDLYEEILSGRFNPNDCSIKATFFVSHKYSNYTAVQDLHRNGHEIAVHSISHNDDELFWRNATQEDWKKEMSGGRSIIERFANITDNSVIGTRAPYLRVGGNQQFAMMEDQAFLYDSTITAALQNPPLWPYTLYYRMPHECHGNGQDCPTRSFAVWEMVMNEMDRREDPSIENQLPGCAMVDSCFSTKPTGLQFKNFLTNNFNRHYDTNRAPMGLFFHSAFLKNDPEIYAAFNEWMDETLATYNDVYFVTMTQVIQWIQDPRPANQMNTYEPWKGICRPTTEPSCYVSNNCELNTDELAGQTLRLPTCMRCPNNYPWLQDPTGNGFF
ncbi:chitin deacetylase 1-like isoform X2 [Oratosquilla oratoria]|uniref:chitin deacetylase 1-like isoform X2 n=1 Tax=Oratosquilla oratoria TaxID=337810 RepID=UPI003F76E107